MINKKARIVLSLITRLIDESKKNVTNNVDCSFNLINSRRIKDVDLSAILLYLRSENLINFTNSDVVIEDISLTEYGRLYPQMHKQELVEIAFKSVLCPIIVTVLTNLLFLAIK